MSKDSIEKDITQLNRMRRGILKCLPLCVDGVAPDRMKRLVGQYHRALLEKPSEAVNAHIYSLSSSNSGKFIQDVVLDAFYKGIDVDSFEEGHNKFTFQAMPESSVTLGVDDYLIHLDF